MLLLFALVACRQEATAQVARDPLGPVRCFQIAQAEQIAEDSAIDLCAGALSDAPGRCLARTLELYPQLASSKVVDLCRAATSLAPLQCFARLDAEEQLTEDQMIAYCGTFCPLGPPPPQTSNPACLTEALDQTNLALQTAGELCIGASSAGPARCFVAGDDLQTLSELKLVRLCRERVQCQYYNVTPE